MYCAQLDEQGICHTVSWMNEAVDGSIVLEVNDYSLIGKRWTGEAWEEVEISEPEPEETETFQMLLMEAVADIFEAVAAQGEKLDTIEGNQLNSMDALVDMYEITLGGGE